MVECVHLLHRENREIRKRPSRRRIVDLHPFQTLVEGCVLKVERDVL